MGEQDTKIEAWFDGAVEPYNPGGEMSWGWVVRSGYKKLGEGTGFFGGSDKNSNNVAEYRGVIDLLDWLASRYAKESITVYGDSQLVIKQMSGEWHIKPHGGLYTPWAVKAKEFIELFADISFEWVPREQNFEADALSMSELTKRGIFRRAR